MRLSLGSADDVATNAFAMSGRPLGMTDDGIVLGDGSILVCMSKDAGGLALDADRDRFQALMSIVDGRPVSVDAFRHVEAADHHWRHGDRALANLRLTLADLPELKTRADVCRLTLAEHLLDSGMLTAELMKELGFSGFPGDVAKYDKDQPRVPAGNGVQSGRFGSGGGSVSPPPERNPPATALVAPGVSGVSAVGTSEAIVGLASRFAGPFAFIAAIVIPTPNSGGVERGTVPGTPDVRFKKDGPAGRLDLTTTAPDGVDVAVHAENRYGVYVDLRTGQPLGRDFGPSMTLDQQAVRAAIDTALAAEEFAAKEGPERGPRTRTDAPEVCPAPEKDRPHGERGLDYEEDVHARVNPGDPLDRGEAVRVWDPSERKYIFVDDCFKTHGDLVDGDMKAGDLVDAKEPEYEELFHTGIGDRIMDKLAAQAQRQLRAADFRGVQLKWYFAQGGAADLVRKKFSDDPDLQRVVISHMPARKRR